MIIVVNLISIINIIILYDTNDTILNILSKLTGIIYDRKWKKVSYAACLT